MITTIREQMKQPGVPRDKTIFSAGSDALLDFKLSVAPFLTWQQKKHLALLQKNVAEAMTVRCAEETLGVSFGNKLSDIPWFCDGLDALRTAKDSGHTLAVEGGPCLFGTDEVLVQAATTESVRLFDYSTGHNYVGIHQETLSEYLNTHAREITSLSFINQKQSLTSQERDSILWLFVIARSLGACVVLPLPDMSYGKYLAAITEGLPSAIADKARREFAETAHQISDLYIRMTEQIAKEYPEVSYLIVHERATELCERYYAAREKHIERNKVLRNITGIPGKLEPIKDYISMPALPYYLLEITDILQVDSLDEIDSYRKCRKAHKGTLNLACMLYPERLSADGVNTIFQAKRELKEYL